MQENDRERKDSKTYVVGNHPVKELLATEPARVDFVAFRKGRHDAQLDEILALCKSAGVPFKSVAPKDLDFMYRGNHQGVAARCAALSYVSLETLLESATSAPLPLIVALDQVQDTGNVGAIARTVYAMGGAGLIVCQHHGAYLGAGAVRASAGALNLLPVVKAGNMTAALKDCVNYDFTVYCAQATEGALDAFGAELDTPAVLVLGNEEKGVRPGVAKCCHQSLRIPLLRDFDSLNVAQAGAILVSEFARRLAK